MYRLFIKRSLDFFLAFTILVLSLPLFFGVSFLLFIQNRGSIFFFQERPGKGQKPFRIIKFKTMSDKKDDSGKLLPDNDRMTAIGKWIRKLSIDEIPQLLNVVVGQMSLIGPRPLLFKYIPLYTPVELRRHEVRPGITGWAQVNGRNAISWKRKFELDIYYVDNISLKLDIKILAMTVVKVLRQENINQSGVRPMMPYDGTN